MQYFIGFIVGIFSLIFMAEIHEGGAQKACQDIAHVKCELKWIAVSKTEGGES